MENTAATQITIPIMPIGTVIKLPKEISEKHRVNKAVKSMRKNTLNSKANADEIPNKIARIPTIRGINFAKTG